MKIWICFCHKYRLDILVTVRIILLSYRHIIWISWPDLTFFLSWSWNCVYCTFTFSPKLGANWKKNCCCCEEVLRDALVKMAKTRFETKRFFLPFFFSCHTLDSLPWFAEGFFNEVLQKKKSKYQQGSLSIGESVFLLKIPNSSTRN